MGTAATWDWALYAGGCLLAVLGAWLLWRGLWADRSRGRARCPKCWYDLSAMAAQGVPLTCAECGRVVKRERQLHRTRRRWWIALVGVVAVAMASGLMLTPRVRRDGAWSIAPTWTVVALDWVWGRGRWASLDAEMRDRLFDDRCPEWAIPRLALTDRTVLRYRDVQVTGNGVVVRGPGMLQPATGGQLNVMFPLQEGPKPHYVTSDWTLGTLEPIWQEGDGATSICGPRDRVFIFVRSRWNHKHGGCRTSQIYAPLPVEWTVRADAVAAPVAHGAIDELVRSGLGPTLVDLPYSSRTGLQVNDVRGNELLGITLGITAELFDSGGVFATASWWQRGDGPPTMSNRLVVIEGDEQKIASAIAEAGTSDCWVRFRGETRMALRDPDVSRYWAGEFVVPISELITPKSARQPVPPPPRLPLSITPAF